MTFGSIAILAVAAETTSPLGQDVSTSSVCGVSARGDRKFLVFQTERGDFVPVSP